MVTLRLSAGGPRSRFPTRQTAVEAEASTLTGACWRYWRRGILSASTWTNRVVRQMVHRVPEADWKLFREVRARALEQFSERTLGELADISQDRSRSAHERYLDVCRTIRERDRVVARTFDNPRRSMLLVHLAAMDELGLLGPDDLLPMTSGTRTELQRLKSLRS
jgi:hypothetical protein